MANPNSSVQKSELFQILYITYFFTYMVFFFQIRSKALYPCECVKGSDNGLYIRCENTNLATLSVALQNLASFGMPIEELTIYRGHFGVYFYKSF